MATPSTREQHKQYCLRSLGSPVIDINVDDEQLEDRIDESLQYFRDYHYDGTEHVYLKHQITSSDKTNEYIAINDNIQGITRLFSIGNSNSSSNIFNIRYQIHLNDLFDFSSATAAPYINAMRHVETLEEIFVGKKPIRFNRHTDKLYLDISWGADADIDDWIVVECDKIIDPDTYADIWSDMFLKRYNTSLMKKQWGQNLIKFEGMQLPGGVTMNGRQMYDDAITELETIQTEMSLRYELPVDHLVG